MLCELIVLGAWPFVQKRKMERQVENHLQLTVILCDCTENALKSDKKNTQSIATLESTD